MSRLVDVYPYHEEQNRVKFLIFKRTADLIYQNQWRMIGEKEFQSPFEGGAPTGVGVGDVITQKDYQR